MDRDKSFPSPVTTSDRVYQILRDQIVHGELSPGTRLVQRQTAAQLNTSAIPVLEAIRRLERDGLLVTHSKWGAQVNSWAIEDAEAAYLMREALEGVASRLFVERATEAEKVELVQRNKYYEEMCRTCDMKAMTEADIAFHLFIVECTKSANLRHLAEKSCVITATIESSLVLTGKASTSNPEDYIGIHDEHVNALLSDDPKRAERVAREIMRATLDRLLETVGKA